MMVQTVTFLLYHILIIHMKRILQQSVVLMTSAIMVLSILTVSMVIIPQAAYAQEYQGNQSSSSANCASDQLPASVNGTIQCMRQGECYSEEFDGKEVKHCNFMMSNQ
jgi:guanyl-specific ribonuclease Sa